MLLKLYPIIQLLSTVTFLSLYDKLLIEMKKIVIIILHR